MKKIGITGTIASGKTSVSILLRKHGFAVFNSDHYAKMATHSTNPCFGSLVEILGEGVLDQTGDIDRAKMADIIFHDEEKRKAVNGVVHPYVIEGMRRFFVSHERDPFAFAEVPLLFEAGLENEFDEICVVTCSKDTAVKRMMEDREYTREQAESRYVCQISPEDQIARAHTVIYNDSDLQSLNSEINHWTARLRKESRNAGKTN
ncbi:MAG: dephospho-CoA kinase [Bulleidia sp.]